MEQSAGRSPLETAIMQSPDRFLRKAGKTVIDNYFSLLNGAPAEYFVVAFNAKEPLKEHPNSRYKPKIKDTQIVINLFAATDPRARAADNFNNLVLMLQKQGYFTVVFEKTAKDSKMIYEPMQQQSRFTLPPTQQS